ncbi:transposase [Streptomyces sp. NBC_00868]|nr:transposase [Streptomyces sp. NBC_00868]
MKHHPAEFKADAVALYRSRPGATIKSVAADLGVNTETLRNWIRSADGRRPGSHSTQPAASQASGGDVQAELAAARKRIRELEEALSELARRLESPRLLEDPPPYRQNAVLRGPRHLPIACDGIRP